MKNKRFTNGLPRIATKEDCNTPWSAVPNGDNFRCCFCGYKFKEGDYWRWQYTNDIEGACGNPLVCKKCDEGPEKTREKWKKKWKKARTEFWWFTK